MAHYVDDVDKDDYERLQNIALNAIAIREGGERRANNEENPPPEEEPLWHQKLYIAECTGGDYPDDESAEHATRHIMVCLRRAEEEIGRLGTVAELREARECLEEHKNETYCPHCKEGYGPFGFNNKAVG